MEQYINKNAVVAEIERLKTIYNDDENIHHVAKYNILVDILSFIDTLEVKGVDNTQYWLVSVRFVLNGGNAECNCFFSYFPAKQDIQNAIGAERYIILHMQNLTEEQFNKLTEREHGI